MSKFHADIYAQPARLLHILHRLQTTEKAKLEQAAALIKPQQPLFLLGIGASYHAALCLQEVARQVGYFAQAVDAGEFLLWESLPKNSVVIALSRSGGSAEMVEGVRRARHMGATLISITNDAQSPMALQTDFVLNLDVPMDTAISVTTYTGLTLLAALLIEAAALGKIETRLVELESVLKSLPAYFSKWETALKGSEWLNPKNPFALFLARGESLPTAIETRLMWEEGAKAHAAALSTGTYRHGPQETVTPGLRIGFWLPRGEFREGDRILVKDMRAQGVKVMMIGHGLNEVDADLILETPLLPPGWAWLVDVMPAQFAAERLANLRGENCDGFKYSAHVVRSLVGLRPDAY